MRCMFDDLMYFCTFEIAVPGTVHACNPLGQQQYLSPSRGAVCGTWVKILVWDGLRNTQLGVVVLSSYVAGTLSPRTHHNPIIQES